MDSESEDTSEPSSTVTSEKRLTTLGEPKGQKLRESWVFHTTRYALPESRRKVSS